MYDYCDYLTRSQNRCPPFNYRNLRDVILCSECGIFLAGLRGLCDECIPHEFDKHYDLGGPSHMPALMNISDQPTQGNIEECIFGSNCW